MGTPWLDIHKDYLERRRKLSKMQTNVFHIYFAKQIKLMRYISQATTMGDPFHTQLTQM